MLIPDAARFHLVSLDVPDAGALRVLIVADDPLVRAGLATLFAERAGYAVAGSASADGDLSSSLAVLHPDVALWDLGYAETPPETPPDFAHLDLPTVALLPDEALAATAWAAGARALLLRSAEPQRIATALVAVTQGLVVFDPALTDAVLDLGEPVPTIEALTPREQEVLALLAEGLPNKLIADRLSISEHTVKFHVGALMGKLGAHSRTEAVIRAARQGLLVL